MRTETVVGRSVIKVITSVKNACNGHDMVYDFSSAYFGSKKRLFALNVANNTKMGCNYYFGQSLFYHFATTAYAVEVTHYIFLHKTMINDGRLVPINTSGCRSNFHQTCYL